MTDVRARTRALGARWGRYGCKMVPRTGGIGRPSLEQEQVSQTTPCAVTDRTCVSRSTRSRIRCGRSAPRRTRRTRRELVACALRCVGSSPECVPTAGCGSNTDGLRGTAGSPHGGRGCAVSSVCGLPRRTAISTDIESAKAGERHQNERKKETLLSW